MQLTKASYQQTALVLEQALSFSVVLLLCLSFRDHLILILQAFQRCYNVLPMFGYNVTSLASSVLQYGGLTIISSKCLPNSSLEYVVITLINTTLYANHDLV